MRVSKISSKSSSSSLFPFVSSSSQSDDVLFEAFFKSFGISSHGLLVEMIPVSFLCLLLFLVCVLPRMAVFLVADITLTFPLFKCWSWCHVAPVSAVVVVSVCEVCSKHALVGIFFFPCYDG